MSNKTDRELLQSALNYLMLPGSYVYIDGVKALREEIRARLADFRLEPRAWVASKSDDGKKDALYWNSRDAGEDGYALIEPLYSHSRQLVRLSDEEICEIAETSRAVEGKAMIPVTFAREIEKAIWEKSQ